MKNQLEIRDVLDEVLSEGAKDVAKKFAETAVGEGAVIAGAALGGLGGAVAAQAVKVLLNAVLRKNDAILSGIKSLISEPLLTGLNEAQIGMLISVTPQDENLRQRALHSALSNFESACSHESLNKDKSALCCIRIIQGFCALSLGSVIHAKFYFAKASPYLNAQVEQVIKEQDMWRGKINDYNVSIEQVRAGRSSKKRTADPFVSPEVECRQLADRAEKAKNQLESLQQQQIRIRELIDMLDLLTQPAIGHEKTPAGVEPA